ncbi:MAG: YMGG-like glycine zipper-containing protein [Alphaproteobacteria bacterium]|nr:YMGG-like glycine zipper-containing protein [Alphaproteobacteria bacterium]
MKHSKSTVMNSANRAVRGRALLFATSLCLILSLTACGNTKGERALSGAGIGAGVGAVGTAVTGGSPWTGAVIGGAVGAATGAMTDKDQIDLDN